MMPFAGLSDDLIAALVPSVLAAAAAMLVLVLGRRDSALSRLLLTALCLVLLWRYLAWRATATLPPEGWTIDYVTGVVFLAVEIAAGLGNSLAMAFLTRTRDRTAEVEDHMAWLMNRPVLPRVDVLICTYNEDEAILERTIVGTLWTNYPNVRIWVCDDGRRPWLAALAEKYSCGYITRADNAHAKAGNINNALRHLASLDEQPDYVAILDADFVPVPSFITRAMTLFHDERVAVVQTPQHFSNPDPIQSNLSIAHVWPDEQRYFFDVVMPAKDAWGAAFCCGTSSIIRFDRLMEIGGFPTSSVTEDYLVSLKLRQRGYETVYLNERLSLGLAPEGLKEYITQRSRWCLGFVQICRSADGPFALGNGLRLADRLILTETFLFWSAAHLFRLLSIWVPILYLLFGIQAVHASLADTIAYFFPFWISLLLSMSWITRGRVLALVADVAVLLAAHSILRAVAVGLIWPKNQRFKVTAKGGDRTRRVVQWPILRMFVLYAFLTLLGIAVTFILDNDRGTEASSGIALFWSWYNIALLIVGALVCVEQPRYRKAERFQVEAIVPVVIDGRRSERFMVDASATGFRFSGTAPGPAGTALVVQYNGREVPGHIVRVLATEFGVEVERDPDIRADMLRHVYATGHGGQRAEYSATEVGAAILARVFR